MSDTSNQARDFLNTIFEGLGLDLHAETRETGSGCLLNLHGADTSLLMNEGGELLEAIQHLVNQTLGRDLPKGERIVCDAENFRATREAELRAMAHHAANRVRKTGVPFTFGPMMANERRIIHLTLAADEDLATESIGEGNARRLKVSLKPLSGK